MTQTTLLRDHCRQVLDRLQSQESGEPSLEPFLADFEPSLRERLHQEFTGLGPLDPWLRDESITEILVTSEDCIWIERDRQLEPCPDSFLSEITYRNFIDRLSSEIGMHANLKHPCADGRWRNFRVHLVLPPLSPKPQLTLRRLTPARRSLKDLGTADWARPAALQMLRSWLENQLNFLIVGPTGSGKTTVLNACLNELGGNERVVCIEDADELHVPNSASSKLLTRFDAQGLLPSYTLTDLVRQSLRMRPDRLVIGEVRGSEARDLLLALATGHRGSLGTLHAADARQALLRLEMLIQMNTSTWETQAVRQLIQLSLDGIVVLNLKEGQRCLEGLYRIASLESFGLLIERVA